MRQTRTHDIVFLSMLISIVTVATYIGMQTPGTMGGYIHLGTMLTFAIAFKYGKRYAAIAGGVGAALFDVFSVYLLWAPATLVIRLVMGYVVGLIVEKNNSLGGKSIAIAVGGVILLAGYFVFQMWILGAIGETDPNQIGYTAAVTSIPGNVAQIILGLFAFKLADYLPSKDNLVN